MTSTALACTVKNYLRVVENLTADLRYNRKTLNESLACESRGFFLVCPVVVYVIGGKF